MSQRSQRTIRFCSAAVCLLLLGANVTTPPAKSLQTPRPGKHGRVLIVPIKGEIDRLQGAFLHRTLKDAKDQYDAVIFEIDTPGGRIDVMAQMSREMIELHPTPTIGFVSPWAISAGAAIAMSTDRIYMSTTSAIGAARPWIPGPDGRPVSLPGYYEEKSVSITRSLFRGVAEAKNYPAAIAEGMVDESLEVKRVIYDGKEMYLKTEEIEEIQTKPDEDAKLEILNTVSPKGRLITFTAKEAIKYGIARGGIANTIEEVLEKEGLSSAEKVRQAQNWSDKVIAILTARELVTLLILIGFGAIWLEMKMPGFGVPGTIAVIAFLLVFGSQFLIGNANALEILLFLVGLALLGIELFVTPGFGVIGGAGILCVLASLVLAMQPFTLPQAPWEFRALQFNLMATLGGVAGSFIVLLLAAWLLPGTSLFGRLTLQKALRVEEGFRTGVEEGKALLGQVGTVVTALRPAGKLEIGDKTYSVVSDAEFINAGRQARVIRVDGPKIVVEPLTAEKPREPEFQA